MGLGSQAGALRNLFDHEELRPDALFAYALAVPAEISRGRARRLFRKIDEIAGGLSTGEVELVELALDERLAMHGLDPVFATAPDESEADPFGEEDEEDGISTASALQPAPVVPKVGRNDPCPCGSGKKYKKCHGA